MIGLITSSFFTYVLIAKKSFVEGLEAVTRRCSIEKDLAKGFVKLT